jgi:hypothetical protein
MNINIALTQQKPNIHKYANFYKIKKLIIVKVLAI